MTNIRDLNAIREQYRRIIEKREFVARREANRVPVVALINELTKLLPDGTWIQRLDLKNGVITLTGESDQASEIPGIVASSQWFTAPRFSSPVTRNNQTGNDRFQIVFNVDMEQTL
jgi:general secretion pathway protein L